MSKEKSFGIGCFHFGIKKLPPFEFRGSVYIKELKKYLSSIPSLNNLKIETADEFELYSQNIDRALPNMGNDIGYFPNPISLDLEFEIYIPFRIQAEIIGVEKKFLRTYSENFKVTILYGFFFPVTIVETENPTKSPSPSTAVMLVREFISKKAQDKKSKYIRFECIGPSPFHINCFLRAQKQNSTKNLLFNSKKTEQSGYDKLVINYNKDKFKNSDEALNHLKSLIMDEFGYCYRHIQIRNSRMYSWNSIQENLKKLVQIQKKEGIKGMYEKLTQRHVLIERLIMDITTLEGQNILDKEFERNEYQQVYPSEKDTIFKTTIDKRLKDKIVYPTKQMTRLISFIENRRVKNLEFIIIIIAAMLGGFIGSSLF